VKTEILYGIHSVREALSAGRRRLIELYVGPGRAASARLREILEAAEAQGTVIREAGDSQLAALAGSAAHQGVALRAGAYPMLDLAAVMDAMDAAGPAASEPVLALDRIVDPHNLGAIMRSALGAGVAAVLIPKDRSALPTPLVSRISAGALEHIRLVQVTNLVRSLERLKSRGRWVAGLDRNARDTIFSSDLALPLVLVVGGEGPGLRSLVRRSCDLMLSIPQSGPLDSLNASVAAGVALYEIRRQRAAARRPTAAGPADAR
jgi:23S rRNA (guanosine2251-2'-O)-methyltransferase